jgi:hypothetical protein
MSQIARFGLAAEAAGEIVDSVKQIIAARWESELSRLGGSRRDRDRIAAAMVPEGFEFGGCL